MREKLIALLEQAKYCTTEELADYLIAAGLKLPVVCKGCKEFDPMGVRPFLGVCHQWDAVVSENGFCYKGEVKK